ncbi:hypothetical protein GLAREA_00135 [Glarea lozoyensis ATCC 20868]|uniref:Uncharacterized protein n=1 Tax=Glarea lozoyensis (strain ATCC 20868 / MF5171) TaxID=1116229 RepID=S3CR89_GLAL2|nr:uncharacterized protein GLAREA_00135 [Glarea lozoyensis ATCC 20868]EPE28977.1 hypothetical protein GLAREA_00135 [Glarea lozoyensis ATCC 20868]
MNPAPLGCYQLGLGFEFFPVDYLTATVLLFFIYSYLKGFSEPVISIAFKSVVFGLLAQSQIRLLPAALKALATSFLENCPAFFWWNVSSERPTTTNEESEPAVPMATIWHMNITQEVGIQELARGNHLGPGEMRKIGTLRHRAERATEQHY